MSDTPRTDEFWRTYRVPYTHGSKAFARQLERELAEARKQRDTLAEALKLCEKHLEKHGREKCDEESDETGWWLLCGVRTALAAVKGGES
jgi:hypothetical protein